MGTLRQQSPRKILLTHRARPRAAPRRDRDVEAVRRRRRPDSRDHLMRRAFRLPTTSERIARELDDEVRFHVEMRAKKLIESGYSTEDAYAEALRRFGDVDDLREYC